MVEGSLNNEPPSEAAKGDMVPNKDQDSEKNHWNT
jgi:hypothetical protein